MTRPELFECKPYNAWLSRKACRENRAHGRYLFCSTCPGVQAPDGEPDDYTLTVHFKEPADRRLLDELRKQSNDLENDIISLLHMAAGE